MTVDIKNYDFIDALRGLAILGVILVHSALFVAPESAALQLLMSAGARGVELFYVISAWTLCMSWEARSAHESSPIRNFFIRRFFRIAPMFYLAILFYLFLYGLTPTYWAPNGVKWWFIPLTALFLHGFHPEAIDSIVPGGWSIAVEMIFYLFLPFLLTRITSIKSCGIAFLLSFAVYAVNKLVIAGWLSPLYPASQQYLVTYFIEYNFLGQFPVFIMGIFVYMVFRKKYAGRLIFYFGGLLLLPFFLMLILPSSVAMTVLRNRVFDGGLFACFALFLSYTPVRAAVNPITVMLGKLSFSMYLTHFAVLELFSATGISSLFHQGNLSSLLHYLLVIMATAAVSFLSYKNIELPGIALGKRLIGRLG